MMVDAEIWTVAKTDQGNAVLVKPKESERAVPIFIGPLEAQNILLGLGDIEIPRPLTHDLMLRLLQDLGAKLKRVDIHSFSEGTYFSNLVLEKSGSLVEIDARPSDALALAVRCGCPIRIEADLVEDAGIALDHLQQASMDEILDDEADLVDEAGDEDEPEGGEREIMLETLRERLDLLVAQELYEEAAGVRDQIRRLEG